MSECGHVRLTFAVIAVAFNSLFFSQKFLEDRAGAGETAQWTTEVDDETMEGEDTDPGVIGGCKRPVGTEKGEDPVEGCKRLKQTYDQDVKARRDKLRKDLDEVAKKYAPEEKKKK